MITLGSLFDGAGTCQFAATQSGVKPMWASEIEPFPVSVTEKRFPNTKHLGDITKINGAEIHPVDVISFGSPCQDLSVAGKRAGLDGERSGLFLEAVRIIKEMRCKTNGKYPKIAIWENVPGAFSSNKGEDFRVVLEELCKIKRSDTVIPRPTTRGERNDKWQDAGLILADEFSIAWRVLDAQFWGVSQRRRRIYLVVDFTGQCAGEILFVREGLSRRFAESRKAWKGITDSVKVGSDAKVWDARGNGRGGIAPTLTGDHNDRITDYTALIVMATQQGGAEIAVNLCPTITAAAGMSGNNQPVLCYTLDRASFNQGINAQFDIGVDGSGIAHTLVAKGPGAIACYPDYDVRRVTPTECGRLQGMPDWWCTDVPHSDSAEYKMWGNGMALPCVMYVFEGVSKLLNRRWLDSLLEVR